MLRASLAVLATIVVVVVLFWLIVESQTVTDEYYVSHAQRMRAIETTENDLITIRQATQRAFEDGRTTPPSVELAFARIAEANDLLQGFDDVPRTESLIQSWLDIYNDELEQYISDGQTFIAGQNTLAAALRTLEEESPVVVRDFREFDLQTQSQQTFSLAIDIIEFATAQSGTDPKQLLDRVEQLSNDATIGLRAPGRIVDFVTAGKSVIAGHVTTRTALDDITGSRVYTELSSLSSAMVADNRRTVSRAERAGLLLSICAVLLLLGAGFTMVRLQSSYRDLNRLNAELENSNITLEERVGLRTEELSKAYDELKASQVQLVQAEKMSSLGQLVAGISHEINTPLWYLMSNSTVVQERLDVVSEFFEIAESMITAVRARTSVNQSVRQGLIDMQRLLKGGIEDDVEEAKNLIQDNIDGLEELTELAQSLKDFSRLDRARQGQFNVNEGLDKTLLIVKNRLKNRVSVHKQYGKVPLIQCSPSQINQIFLNLLTNAADAIQESGDIVIHTWRDNNNVAISISDTGSGIPADVLPKIRDPFFTTKEVGKGTGLGLSIVDQIVTRHHGEFQIDSEQGRGTTVTVVLPIVAPEQARDRENSDGDIVQAPATKDTAGHQDTSEFQEETPKIVTA